MTKLREVQRSMFNDWAVAQGVSRSVIVVPPDGNCLFSSLAVALDKSSRVDHTMAQLVRTAMIGFARCYPLEPICEGV